MCVTYDHVSNYCKYKVNFCQHDFTKSKSILANLATYIDFITSLVRSQHQVDLLPHDLLLSKITDYRLYAGYVNLFHSYLTNTLFKVHYSGALSSPSEVSSSAPQASALGALLFNIFISKSCDIITCFNYFPFADNIKNYIRSHSFLKIVLYFKCTLTPHVAST